MPNIIGQLSMSASECKFLRTGGWAQPFFVMFAPDFLTKLIILIHGQFWLRANEFGTIGEAQQSPPEEYPQTWRPEGKISITNDIDELLLDHLIACGVRPI